MMTHENIQTRQRNIRQLWILSIVFALPLFVSRLLYFNSEWLPQGRSNHGALIDPRRTMQSFTLQTPGRGIFDWEPLQNQWTLTVLAEGRCDDHCIGN